MPVQVHRMIATARDRETMHHAALTTVISIEPE